jgi:hypothetical protein
LDIFLTKNHNVTMRGLTPERLYSIDAHFEQMARLTPLKLYRPGYGGSYKMEADWDCDFPIRRVSVRLRESVS